MQKEVVVILGMHRSGTSLVAGLIAQHGYSVGKSITPATPDNPKGYFENISIINFNKRLLEDFDSSWESVHFSLEQMSPARLNHYVLILKELFIREFDSPKIVLKDPRINILLPIYLELFRRLEVKLKIVFVYREIKEVLASLHKRDGMSHQKGLLLWLKYFFEAEALSKAYARVFVDYNRLLEFDSQTFANLSTLLGFELRDKENFLQKSLNRSKGELDIDLAPFEHLDITDSQSVEQHKRLFYKLLELFYAKDIFPKNDESLLRHLNNYRTKDINLEAKLRQKDRQLQRQVSKTKQNEGVEVVVIGQNVAKNAHFIKNLNAKITASTARYLLFLDEDLAVDASVCNELLPLFEKSDDIGVVVPLIDKQAPFVDEYFLNIEGYEALCARLRPYEGAKAYIKGFSNRIYTNIDSFSGFCFLAKRELFSAVGGFNTFKHAELDFSLRMRARGYSILLADDTYIKAKNTQKILYKTSSPCNPKALENIAKSFASNLLHKHIVMHFSSLFFDTPYRYYRAVFGRYEPLLYDEETLFITENIDYTVMGENVHHISAISPNQSFAQNFIKTHEALLFRHPTKLKEYPTNTLPRPKKKPSEVETSVAFVMLVKDNLAITKEAIESFYATLSLRNFELIVVDNDSKAPTKAYLNGLNYPNLRIITNSYNKSFSKANNDAIAQSTAEFFCFLNNDLVFLQGDWIEKLLEAMGGDTAITAPLLCYPDFSIQSLSIKVEIDKAGRFIGAKENKRYFKETKEVNAVTGACFLITKEAFNVIEGFDERFFYGLEDIDLCFKLLNSGFKIKSVPDSVVIHNEGSTRGFNKRDLKNKKYLIQKWGSGLGFLDKGELLWA